MSVLVPNIEFVPQVTAVPAAWLNPVNDVMAVSVGLAGLTRAGAFALGGNYAVNDYVSSAGKLWACTATVTGATLAPASDPAHWRYLGFQQASQMATSDGFGDAQTSLDRRIATVANITALRLLTTATMTATAVDVLGYYTASLTAAPDNGGGIFVYDAADVSSVDNGGTIIVDASGRRWKRQYSGAVWARWFGAKGDGSTNDTTALQQAINFCMVGETATRKGTPLVFGYGRFKFSQLVVSGQGGLFDADFTGAVLLPDGSQAVAIKINCLGTVASTPIRDWVNFRMQPVAGVTSMVQMVNTSFMHWQNPSGTGTGANYVFELVNDGAVAGGPTAPNSFCENNTFTKPSFTGFLNMFRFRMVNGASFSFARTVIKQPFGASSSATAWFYAEDGTSVYDSHITDISGNWSQASGTCIIRAGGDWVGSTVGPFTLENYSGNTGYLVNVGGDNVLGKHKPRIFCTGYLIGIAYSNADYADKTQLSYLQMYPGITSVAYNSGGNEARPNYNTFSDAGFSAGFANYRADAAITLTGGVATAISTSVALGTTGSILLFLNGTNGTDSLKGVYALTKATSSGTPSASAVSQSVTGTINVAFTWPSGGYPMVTVTNQTAGIPTQVAWIAL